MSKNEDEKSALSWVDYCYKNLMDFGGQAQFARNYKRVFDAVKGWFWVLSLIRKTVGAEEIIEELLPHITCQHEVSKDEDGDHHSVTHDIDAEGKIKLEVLLSRQRSYGPGSFLKDPITEHNLEMLKRFGWKI